MSHRMLAQDPIEVPGGSVRITDSSNFPSASTIAAAWAELRPGALRELHWHPDSDEWQYWISGHARMTVFGSSGKARTFDYYPGDVGYVPRAMGHYFQAIADQPVQMPELFRSDHFADLPANQRLALTPAEVVAATLNLDRDTIAVMRKDKPLIMPQTLSSLGENPRRTLTAVRAATCNRRRARRAGCHERTERLRALRGVPE